jgi:long-chain fatty acid transport protein
MVSSGRAAMICCASVVWILAPIRTYASGLDAPIVGSGQSGPVTADPAAIHWNPGALGAIEGFEVFAGAGVVAGRAEYKRQWRGTYLAPDLLRLRGPASSADIDSNKSGWASPVVATPIAPLGGVFLAAPITSHFVVGLGAYVPYAASLDYPDDGAQRFRLQQAFILASHVAASVAVRLGAGLSIGGSVQWVSGVATFKKVQDFAEVDEFRSAFANPPISQANDFGANAPSDVRELDVLARPISIQDAVSQGISFNAGIFHRSSPSFRWGLSYQHGARMNYRGRFAIDLNEPFFTRYLAPQGLKYPPLVKGDAEIEFRLPRRLTAGAGMTLSPRLSLDGFVSYVFYSDVDAFVVTTHSPQLAQPALGLGPSVRVLLPRAWRDTITLETNVRINLTDSLLVSGTAGYQSPTSPDATIDAASVDGHRFVGGVGGVLRLTRWLDVHADARVQGILPRAVTTSQNDVANGRYSLLVGYVGSHLKAKF